MVGRESVWFLILMTSAILVNSGTVLWAVLSPESSPAVFVRGLLLSVLLAVCGRAIKRRAARRTRPIPVDAEPCDEPDDGGT
jgi:hypothetical protein